MKINFYATLRQIVGKKTVEVDLDHGITVRGVIDVVLELYPPLRNELMNKDGDIYPHVHILVNGRDAPFLENALETQVNPEDTISIFPAVGGG